MVSDFTPGKYLPHYYDAPLANLRPAKRMTLLERLRSYFRKPPVLRSSIEDEDDYGSWSKGFQPPYKPKQRW